MYFRLTIVAPFEQNRNVTSRAFRASQKLGGYYLRPERPANTANF